MIFVSSLPYSYGPLELTNYTDDRIACSCTQKLSESSRRLANLTRIPIKIALTAPLNQQRALSSTLLLLEELPRARPHSTAKSTIFHCLCMMPVLPWSAVGGVRSEDA